MNQDIADTKYRVIFLFSDRNRNHASILFHNHAMQSKRKCHPLVFLDATVIMCIQKCHLRILIKGILLQIQAGGIDMGTQDIHALLHGL